ncbi:hypothetical protein CULCOIPH002_07710 [Corynebacterium ulcerans]|uniref:Uncharacterized protein n=1 Tax=Corynebacterium ulcerans TaxID=65058 RepID=A0ABD0BHB4_CORUL|nr:hypothetical protein CULCOIPH001_03830 [Corynebacterium ulcerans]GJJ35859.1 hypothetical protein CULCOIPH002_07710 [Corynebacterium ulcerans]GJJ42284.1 hypothetical protein CULCOIPH005_04730 [Corynebacterium ulcerans]
MASRSGALKGCDMPPIMHNKTPKGKQADPILAENPINHLIDRVLMALPPTLVAFLSYLHAAQPM